jgi:hypothetical protein
MNKFTEAKNKGSTTSEQLLLAAMLPVMNIFESEYIDEQTLSKSRYYQGYSPNDETFNFDTEDPLYKYNLSTKRYDGEFTGDGIIDNNDLMDGETVLTRWQNNQAGKTFNPAAYTRAYMFYKAVCKENIGNGISAQWAKDRLGPDNAVTQIQPYYIPRMIVNAFYAGSDHKEFLSSCNSRKNVLLLNSDDAQNSDWVELVNRIRDTGVSTKEDQKLMYDIWADWGIMLDDYFPEADIGSHDINVAKIVDEILEEAKKAQEELKTMDKDQKSIFMQMRRRICSLGGQYVLLSQADFATVKAAFEELFPGEVVEPIAPKPRAPRKRKTVESTDLISEFMKL